MVCSNRGGHINRPYDSYMYLRPATATSWGTAILVKGSITFEMATGAPGAKNALLSGGTSSIKTSSGENAEKKRWRAHQEP